MSDDGPLFADLSDLDVPLELPLKKPSLLMEITFFFIMTSITLGLAYVSDPTTVVQDIVLDNINISSAQYGMFSSLYSFPNIIFVLFGGVIVDNIVGVRWAAFIFSVIILLGHAFFTAGFYWNSMVLMLIGRFVVGIGGESLSVATSKYLVLWFKNRSLTLAFSINLAFMRVGAVFNLLFSRKLYVYFRDKFPLFKNITCLSLMYLVGLGVCIFSVICSIVSGVVDKKVRSAESTTVSKKHNDNANERVTFCVKMKQYLNLGATFYMISLACVIFYAGFPCFTQFAISHLTNKYMVSGSYATFVLILYTASGIVISPLAGLFVTAVGFDLTIVFFSIALCATIHLAFTFSFMNPYIMIIITALSTNFVNCVMWPIVAYVVPEEKIGIGYGIMQCIQNLGLTLSPIAAGALLDYFGFFTLQVYIVSVTTIAAMVWSVLFVLDFKSCNGILDASQKKRRNLKNPHLDDDFDA